MTTKKLRMIIDIAMTVLSVILMGGTVLFVDDKVHQVLGLVVLTLWLCHTMLNYRWFSSIFRGKYQPYRTMQLVINLGISISAVFLMISGMMMAWFLPINFDLGFARISHLVASHWYYFFMSLHLGMHVQMIFNKIKTGSPQRYKKTKQRAIAYTVLVLVCIYGIYSFFNLNIPKYMFFLQQFFFLDLERSYLFFAVDYLSMLVLIAMISHLLARFLLNHNKNKIQKTTCRSKLDNK